ncbi:MAG: type IV pilin N-terminal domain-containing protein [Nitrososphaerales archaeon]
MVRAKAGITPIIATALLLVISITAVTLIAYTATSLSITPKKAPNAIFAVEISKTGSMGYGYIHIEQKAGDPVKSSDLKIIFNAKGVRSEVILGMNYMFVAQGDNADISGSITSTPSTYAPAEITVTCKFNKDGKDILMPNILVRLYNKTENTLLKEGYTNAEGKLKWFGSYKNFAENTKYNVTLIYIDANGKLTNKWVYDFTVNANNWRIITVTITVNSGDYGYYYGVPWKFVPGQMPSTNSQFWFGNFTYTAGTMSTGDGLGAWTNVKYLWDDVHAMIRNWDDLNHGDVVEVMIVYLPTNQVIWQGSVGVS